MNVPTTDITTINTVTCFQCFEKIVGDGDIVFGLNNRCRNVHTTRYSLISLKIALNECQAWLASRQSGAKESLRRVGGLRGAGQTVSVQHSHDC
jgi:hypothetical protein